jgi:hypothetical protein
MANEVIDPVVPVVAAETDKSADPEIAKIINSAVTSQLKRLLPKAIEQAVSGLAKPIVEAGSEAKETPSANPELEELRRTIAKQNKSIEALTNKEKQATQKARSASLTNELTSALKGRVTDDWLDVAVEKLASKATFSDLDEPSLKFGEDELSITDGVAQWMKDPSSKRFLAAPKANQTNRIQAPVNKFQPIPSANQGAQGVDPLSPEYENVMAQALHAQGGLLGGRS